MKVYTQLKIEEREIIFNMRKNGASLSIIGGVLDRNKSSIGRELIRNKYSDEIAYLPDSADKMAKDRKHKLQPKLDRHENLKEHVVAKLKDGWAPDVIAGSLKTNNAATRISGEAIYQYVYSAKGKALSLYSYLATGRDKRNKKYGRKSRKPIIEGKTSIHQRPQEANDREEEGHFEGDLTFCKGDQSANIMVITERKTRYVILIKNESKKATGIMKRLFNVLAILPQQMRKSITFDNGTEFAHHQLLKDHLRMDTYFCDPHSPWQKGQVEKTNAMLHRRIPKNSILPTLDEKSLMDIQNKFNNIPRKVLRYKTPAELFNNRLQEIRSVALQT
jgi:IS30 family transposase